jgi:CBS domain-containing membrane protein
VAVHNFLRSLWPQAPSVSQTEQWRSGLGAVLAIALTGWLSHWLVPEPNWAWLVAPMGASAVLLLALPSSPMTQPWPVIGGNTLSALVGLAVCQWLPQPDLAAGVAVGMALLAMFFMRCLHPPGGAMALLVVLTQTHDWRFSLVPVLLNSVLLVLLCTAYNRLTGKAYPKAAMHSPEVTSPRFTTDDLDAALRHYNQVIDMDRQDLQALLHDAQAHAYQRTLGQLRCSDIMTKELVTVRGHESLGHAWQLLLDNRIKSLPVVDERGHVMGIVTRADFVAHWHGPDAPQRDGSAPDSTVVRQLMSRQVRVASDTARVIDLLPFFSREGHHHLPIIDGQQVLVGMVTESDVVRALHRALS